MEVNSEIGAVIDGRIRIFYLCFTYIPVSPLVLFLVKENFKSVSKVPKFRVNSLFIVYHCAIHNLPIFIERGRSEGEGEELGEGA